MLSGFYGAGNVTALQMMKRYDLPDVIAHGANLSEFFSLRRIAESLIALLFAVYGFRSETKFSKEQAASTGAGGRQQYQHQFQPFPLRKGLSFLPSNLISFDCFQAGSASVESQTKLLWIIQKWHPHPSRPSYITAYFYVRKSFPNVSGAKTGDRYMAGSVATGRST